MSMISRSVRTAAIIAALATLGACSSLNPFASTPKIKPAELTDIKTSLTVRSLWSTTIGNAGGRVFVPALTGGAAYLAAADGTVARLALDNGAQAWRVNAGAPLSAGVGSDGTLVAVVSSAGELIVLNADGTPRWKAPLNAEVLSPPAVAAGIVVVRTGDSRVVGFDADTGKKRWTYSRPNPALVLRSAPQMAIGGGLVFVGFPGGRMAAINLSNGGARWEIAVALPKGATELERVADVVGAPVLIGREVCVAAFQGRVGCFEAATGNAVWARDISSSTGVGVDGRYAFVADDKSVIQAFSRGSGSSVWRNDKLQHRDVSAPASVGRAVVVGDYRGVVHWLSREDGAFIARSNTDGGAVVSPPQAFDLGAIPAVLIQTQSGAVHAFGAE